MWCKAIFLAPFWLSTSPLMKMTQFRLDDALITGGQALEAGITVSLIKALLGFSAHAIHEMAPAKEKAISLPINGLSLSIDHQPVIDNRPGQGDRSSSFGLDPLVQAWFYLLIYFKWCRVTDISSCFGSTPNVNNPLVIFLR